VTIFVGLKPDAPSKSKTGFSASSSPTLIPKQTRVFFPFGELRVRMTTTGSLGRMVRAVEGMSRASGFFDSALRASLRMTALRVRMRGTSMRSE